MSYKIKEWNKDKDQFSYPEILFYTGNDFEYVTDWCYHKIAWVGGYNKFSESHRLFVDPYLTVFGEDATEGGCLESYIESIEAIKKEIENYI